MTKTLRADNIDKNKPIVSKNVTITEKCNGCQQKSDLRLKVVANAGMFVRANITGICEAKVKQPPTNRKVKCGWKILFFVREKMPEK
jgi:hypothetical protein